MKMFSCRRRICWKILGVGVLVAVLFFVVTQYRDIPLIESAATTIYTTPRKSDGQVDFFRCLENANYPESMATEENGFRLVLENVNVSNEITTPELEELCSKVGLAISEIDPKLNYVGPYEYGAKYFSSEDFDESLVRRLDVSRGKVTPKEIEKKEYDDYEVAMLLSDRYTMPWTEVELPMLTNWVNENNAVLALYARAIRLPAFDFPMIRRDDSELIIESHFYSTMFRSIARGYNCRANYHLGNGNIRKAMDDVLSCKRLGRHIRNRNTGFDRLLGIAIEGIADSTGVMNAASDLLTAEDLLYFTEGVNSLPKLSSCDGTYLCTKLILMDILQKCSRTGDLDYLEATEEIKQLKKLGLDWNVVFEEFHQAYDKQKSDGGGLEQEIGSAKVTFVDRVSRSARSRKFARAVVAITSPQSIPYAEFRSVCQQNLRRISIAMLRYEKDHGRLPPAFSTDSGGKKLHSWRVLLLPYLGEQELFAKIRLGEPWDSSHNCRFNGSCPLVYNCPSCESCQNGDSSYCLILGNELPFEGDQGKSLDGFGPDCNDMILVAERTTPVGWMDPTVGTTLAMADLGMNDSGQDQLKTGSVGSSHFGGANFALRNGSASFLSKNMDLLTFQKMLRGTNTTWLWD